MGKLFIGIGVGPGLGASTAERFAQEGFDILLTARNKDRVLELANAIAKKTGVKATALELNASSCIDGQSPEGKPSALASACQALLTPVGSSFWQLASSR
jgi:NAD(P)-dependent dehydrogenase (short-subunit alcohol dehydrogenase family)